MKSKIFITWGKIITQFLTLLELFGISGFKSGIQVHKITRFKGSLFRLKFLVSESGPTSLYDIIQ